MPAWCTRRRFLAIAAATVAAPARADETAIWRGIALGATAEIRLVGVSPAAARPVFAEVAAELDRLEDIFSLYRPGSVLEALNRTGRLASPPADLLRVLTLCGQLHRASTGAFDPTVQVLWQTYAAAQSNGSGGDAEDIRAALTRTGWDQIRFDRDEVSYALPGMALTLNGIAQGYITDRIAGLLQRRGYRNVLVDMGEILAQGARSDGLPWVAGIAADDGAILRRITLRNRALATSSPSATVLDPAGKIGHIIDPRNGIPARGVRLVSVSAPSAALADGLSTACCLLNADLAAKVVTGFPGANLEIHV